MTALAPETVRDRKILSGSSGFAVRASRTTNAIRATSVAAAPASVAIEVQPTSLVRMIVRTPSISAPVTSAAPGTSAPWPRPSPSSS